MLHKLLPTALLVLTLCISCGPRLEPAYDGDFNCFDHLDSVPIIVVATIEPGADARVGTPFLINSLPGHPIALAKARVSIENVLKGVARLGDATIFYFAETSATGPPTEVGFTGAHTFRNMTFLRREAGKFRLFRDVRSQCEALVYSGAHLNFKPTTGEPLPEQIIDVFLTPGEGTTDIGMVRAIFDDSRTFKLSHEYTIKAILRLAAAASPVVRTAACLEFRDIMAQLLNSWPNEETALGEQLGVSRSEVVHWREEYKQNGLARDWWARGPQIDSLPTSFPAADRLRGLALCRNDKALGVPPLRPETPPDLEPMQKS